MLRGLIGLEYPPLKQRLTDYKDDYGPPISETIPPTRSQVATKLVHSNIDPRNSKAVVLIPCHAPGSPNDASSLI